MGVIYNDKRIRELEKGIGDLNDLEGVSIIDKLNNVNNDLHGQNVPLSLGTLIGSSYINVEGDFASYNGWKRTDYIDVSGLVSLIPSKGTGSSNDQYNAFYDASKNFIEHFYVTANQKVNIPPNAKYVAFSNTDAFMDGFRVSYNGAVKNIREVNASLQTLIGYLQDEDILPVPFPPEAVTQNEEEE